MKLNVEVLPMIRIVDSVRDIVMPLGGKAKFIAHSLGTSVLASIVKR
jgi:hypothetical protein